MLLKYYKGELNADPTALASINKDPYQIRILRPDVRDYVESDPDLFTLRSQAQLNDEKVTVLEQIMESIQQRQFYINSAIKWKTLIGGQ